MSRYYYDLHIHSCLSPCADNDNTPNNIAGMAKLAELDIVALTDHNSVKNCPAFFEAAERYGIVPVAGMELTTSEDIHMICLFERLEDALVFGDEIDKRRMPVKNRPEIFGDQTAAGMHKVPAKTHLSQHICLTDQFFFCQFSIPGPERFAAVCSGWI